MSDQSIERQKRATPVSIPDAAQLAAFNWLLDRLFSPTPPAYPPGYGPPDAKSPPIPDREREGGDERD